MAVIGQDQIVLWFQPEGPSTPMLPFGIGENAAAMTGKSVPGAGRTPTYGRTEFGLPVVIKVNREAPGDLPSATIQLYERGQVDILLRALQQGCPINIQSRIVRCGRLNNPNVWSTLDHWAGGEITTYTPGDGPSLEFNGEIISVEGTVSFTHYIRLVELALSNLTTVEAEDILSIAGIPDEDCNRCGNGYPGADRILYFGAAGGTAAGGNLLYSTNGGGTIAATTAEPFATAGEQPSDVVIRPVNITQYRVIAFNNVTAAGAKARFAWADVTYGAPDIAAWNTVIIAATVNGDVIQAANWAHFDRLYIAAAGDIYVSTNQGTSDPGAAIYTGSTAINGFTKSPDNSVVWAFGASNLILRELQRSGTFEVKVGPSGGGAFGAVAVASDGTLYAGNGTSIWKSTDNAATAGNWVELYDFGSDHAVVAIQVIGGSRANGGDSQLLRAVVDDSAGGSGQVWFSVDGGATWTKITELANLGYNAAYFSETNDNLGIVVGDASGGTGKIQRFAPAIA